MNQVAAAKHRDDCRRDLSELQAVCVLIVEDDETCREALATALEERGAQVTAVSSVGAALRCFEPSAPAVLISDIEMPGQNGIDLIHQVREIDAKRARRTPAIAVSGLCTGGRIEAIHAAGFDEYMSKPIDLSSLVQRIRALVGS